MPGLHLLKPRHAGRCHSTVDPTLYSSWNGTSRCPAWWPVSYYYAFPTFTLNREHLGGAVDQTNNKFVNSKEHGKGSEPSRFRHFGMFGGFASTFMAGDRKQYLQVCSITKPMVLVEEKCDAKSKYQCVHTQSHTHTNNNHINNRLHVRDGKPRTIQRDARSEILANKLDVSLATPRKWEPHGGSWNSALIDDTILPTRPTSSSTPTVVLRWFDGKSPKYNYLAFPP